MGPRFKVGDIVHIVDEPVALASTWVWQMDRYCGCEAVITYAAKHRTGTGVYGISMADGHKLGWSWNDEAFKEYYDAPENKVAVSDEDLIALLEVM